MKTIDEALARVATLERELANEARARKAAEDEARLQRDKRKSARRKVRLELAAKAQRKITDMQQSSATIERPSGWYDGAVLALEAFHGEIEKIADDDDDAEG